MSPVRPRNVVIKQWSANGTKQTFLIPSPMSANDPKQTFPRGSESYGYAVSRGELSLPPRRVGPWLCAMLWRQTRAKGFFAGNAATKYEPAEPFAFMPVDPN